MNAENVVSWRGSSIPERDEPRDSINRENRLVETDVRTSISAIEASNDVTGSVEDSHVATRCRRVSPITMALAICLMVAGAHTALQRIGTTANADTVEYTPNLAGGYFALGMTDDQPGFIVLSALDRNEVGVNAVQNKKTLAGSHTIVEVQTPRAMTRIRLRGPQVVLVTEVGVVEQFAIDWTVEEFRALRRATDCSHGAAMKKHRRGAPFADLHEAFAGWPAGHVPDRVRAFLEPFKDHRAHKHKDD